MKKDSKKKARLAAHLDAKREDKKQNKKSSDKKSEEKKTSVLVDEEKHENTKTRKHEIDSSSKKKDIKEVKAKARFLRVSPKKVKLVIDVIRGLGVEDALNKLKLINKGSVALVIKLVNSAIANAENNFELKKEDLYIKHIAANQGPTLHRWKPAAFGSAHPIRKRSTHLELILGVVGASVDSAKTGAVKKSSKTESKQAVVKESPKVKAKSDKKVDRLPESKRVKKEKDKKKSSSDSDKASGDKSII